jgi:hypothetical protein
VVCARSCGSIRGRREAPREAPSGAEDPRRLKRPLALTCASPRRDGEIRTPDPLLPKQVRYLAAPHPGSPLPKQAPSDRSASGTRPDPTGPLPAGPCVRPNFGRSATGGPPSPEPRTIGDEIRGQLSGVAVRLVPLREAWESAPIYAPASARIQVGRRTGRSVMRSSAPCTVTADAHGTSSTRNT